MLLATDNYINHQAICQSFEFYIETPLASCYPQCDMVMIGERIKELRSLLKVSQQQFSKRIFISQSHLADIELGNQGVNDKIIHLIFTEFNVNKHWLLNGEGDIFKSEKPDIRLETVIDIFKQLDDELQEYLLSQAKFILKIKKERSDKKQA